MKHFFIRYLQMLQAYESNQKLQPILVQIQIQIKEDQ